MKKFEAYNNQGSNIQLNEDERRHMRESLLAYMEKVPVLPGGEAASIYRPARTGWVVGVGAGIIIAGAGVLAAAQYSLPGSFLYPIRTAINDRIFNSVAHSSNTNAAPQQRANAAIMVDSSTSKLTNSTLQQ